MAKNNEVKVSVFCLAYNHEEYIEKALKGFVMQETDFAFEVLINDDASTDGTADIIRRYEKQYPEIIKPVYQSENQYSKGIGIIKNYLLPKAQGEFLAWCEGDDYWTDPKKLQKQYNFLSANPDYTVCAHKTVFHKVSDNTDSYFPNITCASDYTTEQIIHYGGGLLATCSLMVRRDMYLSKPDCFKAKGFGDYQLYLYGSICGKVHCLNDVMSVYNYGVVGSWSTRTNQVSKKVSHFYDFIDMLKRVDEYYDRQFHEAISKRIDYIQYSIYKLQNDKKSMRQPRFRLVRRNERRNKIAAFILKYCPIIITIKKKLFG